MNNFIHLYLFWEVYLSLVSNSLSHFNNEYSNMYTLTGNILHNKYFYFECFIAFTLK